MIVTPNMNLTVWDQPGDNFSHPQLSAALQTIDAHDHSPTKGQQINTAGIVPQAITTALLAQAAVTNAILATNAVATANVQDASITRAKLANGAVDGTALEAGSVDFAQLASDVLPLGTVMLWWTPSGSGNVPGGPWEIMDGRPWNSISNTMGPGGAALTTGNIPDLRNQFVIGADILGTSGPGIGNTGGSATANVAHTHTVAGHSHSVNSHTHGINSDGNHYHTWSISFTSNPDYPAGLAVSGLDTWYRTNSFKENITVKDYPAGNQHQNVYGSLYIKNALYDIYGSPGVQIDAPAHMDTLGAHTHGGATNGSSPGTSSVGLTTDSSLTTINLAPQNVALLFVMRVR